MDPATLALIAIGVVMTLLITAAVVKMVRGQLHAGEPHRELSAGERALEEQADAALEREALGIPSEAPPPPGEPKEAAKAAPEEVETPEKAMRRGLEKTRSGLMARINGLLFGGRALDPALADELEEILVTSDIGVKTTERLLSDLRAQLGRKEISDPEVVRTRLKDAIQTILSVPLPPLDFGQNKPLVIMVIGVNGVGKTTTIGKLAARFAQESKSVVVAAGDTFRAAAVEQLEVWAARSGAKIVKGPENGDPASVMFEAIQTAQRVGADVCIADTAGRLHTKVNLMEELKKVRRVMAKAMPSAPHEVLLVLDATTGQNAIAQAQQFTEAVQVGSLVLTKLDGTAKGGVVVAISDALKLPVRYIGVGEKVEDLRDFVPAQFATALFEREGQAASGAAA
jgi:fused signal recognition particle receptor